MMKILDNLISTLNLEAEVRDIRLGPFQTAVLTGNCGWQQHPTTLLTTRNTPR